MYFKINSKNTISLEKKVDIVITYKNDENIITCLKSIEKNFSPIINKIIIVEDNCEDVYLLKKVKEIINNKDFYIYLKNKISKGHIYSVNKGLKKSNRDVIILNSDTIVTKNWVDKLYQTAYSKKEIGTVTPLSNNANVFSLPKPIINFKKDFNFDKNPEFSNKILEYFFPKSTIETPTGHGFCMYIKKEVINKIGLLDYENFKPNYAEENDYCMRVLKAGYKNVLACNTYIFHIGGYSYGNKKTKLVNKHHAILLKKHPDFDLLIQKFIKDNLLENIRYFFNPIKKMKNFF